MSRYYKYNPNGNNPKYIEMTEEEYRGQSRKITAGLLSSTRNVQLNVSSQNTRTIRKKLITLFTTDVEKTADFRNCFLWKAMTLNAVII